MPAAEVGDLFYDPQSGLYFDVFTVSATAFTGTVEVTYPREGEAAYNQISYNIPKTVSHDGITFTVTGIYGEAFKNCETLESVTIPDTVTTIGGAAFSGCSNLSSINIPDSVTTIEDMAFAYCTELDMLTIPASVTNIESLAFFDSNLKVMVWHDARKTIGENAFHDVSSVTHKLVTPTDLAYDSGGVFGNGVAYWKTNGTASGYNVYIYDSADETVAKWDTTVVNDKGEGRNHLDMGDFLAEKGAPSGTYSFSVRAYGGFSDIYASEWSERWSFSYVKGAVPVVSDVTLTRRNEVSATLTFTVSEDCTLYYTTAYAAPPDALDTTGTGIACTAGTNTVIIPGLSADNDGEENKKWHVKFVLKDADGNLTDIHEKNVEKWTYQYSLTFETNGGTLLGPPEVYICNDSSIPITLPDATRTGYTLKGWTTAADGSGTIYPVNAGFTVTGNHIFYAQWELAAVPVEKVTVTFQMNGHGEAIDSQTITAASKATEPEAPTEEGWRFGGWYTDADCTTEYNFDTPVTQDITLYAKWVYGNKIFVTYGEETLALEVELNNTIDAIKTKIQEKKGISPDQQRLFFNGDRLEGGKTLSYYKITWGSTLTLKLIHTVTFDTQSHGTAPDSQNVTEGEKATEPAAPTAQGWRFGGWYTDATCTNLWDFDTPVTGDLTLYAKWTQEQQTTGLTLTLKFDYTDGYDSTQYTPGIQDTVITGITPGTVIDLPQYWPASLTWNDSSGKTYHFSCFYENAAGGNGYDSIKMTQDTTLYAGWSENPHVTITFDTKGGSLGCYKTRSEGIEDLLTLNELYAPTRVGYTFLGWSEEDDGTADDVYTQITQDTTLYAVWEELPDVQVGQVTLKDGEYTTNGTSTTTTKPESGGYAYYKDGVLTLNNFTYSGGGKENNAVIYADQDLSIALVGSNVITASALSAIRIDGHKLRISGDSLNLTASDKDGLGIYLLSTGSGLTIENAALTISAGYYGIASFTAGTSLMISDADLDIKVEGPWSSAINCATTVIKNSEVKLASPRIAINANTALTIENSTVNAEGLISSNDDKTATFTSGHLLVSSDSEYGTFYPTELFASLPSTYWWRTSADGDWTKNTEAPLVNNKQPYVEITTTDPYPMVTVTFDTQGRGDEPAAQKIEKGTKATDPGSLTAPGYTFGGWYTEATCTNLWDFDTPVTGDLTLYAKWTADVYTLTFDANGHGTAPAAQTITMGEKATRPADPTADGYAFGGWYRDAACTTAYDFTAPVTGNITLYAKWTQIHVHTWATDWSNDVTHHWHNCTAENCDLTGNTQKDGYGAHSDNGNGICGTCGYILKEEPQESHKPQKPQKPQESHPRPWHREEKQEYDSDSPKTGDTTQNGLWLTLAAVGLLGLTVSLVAKKRLRKKK